MNLTYDVISAIPAGKVLNALVAEYVMGWTWATSGMLIPPIGDRRMNWAAEWDEEGLPNWLPGYSTDIRDAAEALDRIRDNVFGIFWENSPGEKIWSVCLNARDSYSGPECMEGETLALAICRAALLSEWRANSE